MPMQRHEMLAWLGDSHGLTDEQVDDLTAIADDIEDRYPSDDPDDLSGADVRDEREAALTAAYRILSGDRAVIDELARERATARTDEIKALAGLRQAALMVVDHGMTESGFTDRAGLNRMSVRKWLGKR